MLRIDFSSQNRKVEHIATRVVQQGWGIAGLTDSEFLAQFTEVIGADPGSVQLDTDLSTLEVWDSVAYLSVMTLVDEHFGVMLAPDSLVGATTPASILELARNGSAAA